MSNPSALLLLVGAAALCVTSLVLLAAVAQWLRGQNGLSPGHMAGGRGDAGGLPRTLAWVSTILLGLATTAVLVVLAVALTWQVTVGHTSADPAPARPAAGLPVSSAEPKDAVSNAMAAVALVVTAVTLVLTVGTTWLGRQQRSLELERARLARALQDVQQWKQLERQRLGVQVLLLHAIDAAKQWAIAEGASADMLFSQVLTIANHLEMLSTDDRDQRGRSFDMLAQFFDGADSPVTLAPVRAYCEACHQLAIARAWYGGQIANPANLEAFIRQGLWCMLFDEQEVRRRIGEG